MVKKISAGKKMAGALSMAAALATVAAGYYFYGKDGKAHRKLAGAWSKKAKMEMLEKIKQMKTVTGAAYHKAAGEVLAKYQGVKNIDPEQLQIFGQELKAHWEEISKQAGKLTGKSQTKKAPVKNKIGH